MTNPIQTKQFGAFKLYEGFIQQNGASIEILFMFEFQGYIVVTYREL